MSTATAVPSTARDIRDHEIQQVPPELLARIRKMLLVAEVKAGEDVEKREGEITNALTMAQRMMTEYGISMNDIEKLSEEARREEIESKKPIHQRLQVATTTVEMQWKRAMGLAIAKSNFCDLLNSRTHFWVIGRPHNVAMVNELMASVFPQVDAMATAASKRRRKTGVPWQDYEITRIPTPTYRLSYALGIASRIQQRLDDARKTTEVELKGTTALVLDTERANLDYMKEEWPYLYGGKPRKGQKAGRRSRGNQTDGRAWAHGFDDGNRVDVSVAARRVNEGRATPALGNGR